MGNIDGMARVYQRNLEESLRTLRRLAVKDPNNIGWQVDLAISLVKLSTKPNLEEALRIFQKRKKDRKLSPNIEELIPLIQQKLEE